MGLRAHEAAERLQSGLRAKHRFGLVPASGAEIVHAHPPLQRDDRALGGLQQADHQDRADPERDSQLRAERERAFADFDNHRCHQVAGDEHRDIGREIVGLMQGPVLPAVRAAGRGLQIAGEQPFAVAARAAKARAPQHGLHQRGGQAAGFGQGHARPLAEPANMHKC